MLSHHTWMFPAAYRFPLAIISDNAKDTHIWTNFQLQLCVTHKPCQHTADIQPKLLYQTLQILCILLCSSLRRRRISGLGCQSSSRPNNKSWDFPNRFLYSHARRYHMGCHPLLFFDIFHHFLKPLLLFFNRWQDDFVHCCWGSHNHRYKATQPVLANTVNSKA